MDNRILSSIFTLKLVLLALPQYVILSQPFHSSGSFFFLIDFHLLNEISEPWGCTGMNNKET